MKKAVATRPGQPTKYVEMTKLEVANHKKMQSDHLKERNANAWLRGRQDPVTGYATIQEQLDMQYNDMVNGTTTWFDHITKVKKDNPKP